MADTDQAHECCLSCTLLASMAPVEGPEDLGPAAGPGDAPRPVRLEGLIAHRASLLVRSQAQKISAVVLEAMHAPQPGGLCNPARYANRIVDLICERIAEDGRP